MPVYQCPACNATNSLRRSKSRPWERPLKRFGLQPFRCKKCSKRFHRRWDISAKSLTLTAIAAAAPHIENTPLPVPVIDFYPSLEVDTPEIGSESLKVDAPEAGSESPEVDARESGSESLNADASDPVEEFPEAEKPSRLRYLTSFTVPYWFKSFVALLLLHFIVGALEFQSLGKAAMWVNLLTLVTLIGALLVFFDLYRTRCAPSKAVGATAALVLRWVVLFFATELVYGVLLGPGGYGFRSYIELYREQSPWIWMTYAMMPVSGIMGCSAYLFYRGRRHVRFLH
jgi:hypothetical protein